MAQQNIFLKSTITDNLEHPDVVSPAPFLLLDEKKKILLFPSLISSHSNVTSWREVAHANSECEFPTMKWVHIGCEDPPVQLSIDSSIPYEIEEDTDGVWSIVGGKASCRRIFSLGVTLMDNFSRPMTNEAEVVATLVYSDNEAPVEKPVDADAPLLTSYDGIEYASSDRPSKVISGRASFKLKISQDFNLLRRVSGCQDLVSQDNFEKLLCWLYPVACTLSQQCITSMWGSTSPMWIEGFITKEEAESSLRSLGALEEPGAFVLRFPISRSWLHPDAGNLVVTYVGSDYTIHHRLLSLEFIYSSGAKGTMKKPIQEVLLEQPELRRLGRVVRSQ
ncbi:unnamed protein product [Withania somnifera]